MRRLGTLVLALCSLALIGSLPAVAREATPASGGFPITPDPAECDADIEPRSLEEIEELAVLAAEATPVAVEPTSVDVPVGEPADAATVAAITATVRTEIACFHARDFLRNAAFYTDEAIRRVFAEQQIPVETVTALFGAEPEEVPADARTTILVVTDVVVLADGRVGAFVVFTDPGAPPVTSFLVFVEREDAWLVDDIITFARPPTEGGGTPTV